MVGKGRGAPSKASGLQMLLVMLEGELFKEILVDPSPGAGQPVDVSQVVAHILNKFHLLIREMVLQEVAMLRVSEGRAWDMQIQKGLVQILIQGQGGLHGILSFTPLILGRLHHVLE